ncbi:GIY-YIG nuclease family protein [Candidatus Pacearchaeota archaeon]|nr:GIY-YIG nuclease family protein [Candidatus Pacearchaeota archaeon]
MTITTDETEILYSIKFESYKTLPNLPAVYMIYSNNECLYIGSTILLRNRIAAHSKKIDFIKAWATDIKFIRCHSNKRLSELETKYIKKLTPSLNAYATRDMKCEVYKQPEILSKLKIKPSSLRMKTFNLLKTRPAGVRLLDISDESGLPLSWIKCFHLRGDRNSASVDKVQTLYEYLTGTSLM